MEINKTYNVLNWGPCVMKIQITDEFHKLIHILIVSILDITFSSSSSKGGIKLWKSRYLGFI